MTVNNYMDKFTDIFIAEMGAYVKGEIAGLCKLVKPKYGIITRIGTAHLETFGSEDNIVQGKFELVESLPSDGFAILNGDDPKQVNYKIKNKVRIIWIGIENENVDVRATNIKCSNKGTSFDVLFKGDEKKYHFETKLLGDHNVYNILAALACGREFDIDIPDLITAVRNVRPVEHRLELKRLGNFYQIDDAYNSNPIGAENACKILGMMPGYKVVVTPGMVELGTKEDKYNKKYNLQELKEIFENKNIKKISTNLSKIYILLKQENIELNGITYDASIAAYILNPTNSNLQIENLANQYLEIDVNDILENTNQKDEQINLFDAISNTKENVKAEEDIKKEESERKRKEAEKKYTLYSFIIYKLQEITMKKLEEINAIDLFNNIDMPTVTILSDMQWNGMYADKCELDKFGDELKKQLDIKTKIIYEMAGEEFNINSTKQLGEILFEKMKLPVKKKTKSGYSTSVEVLEKLKSEDPIIDEILEYRQLQKLNSTYVEGLKPYINPKTQRIHSFFHQTITATGRISSTEPNLQNIPTRFELGKQVRKIFKPEKGKIYIDADYSQIELRVLASMSGDKNMIQAFKENKDIHKQAASKVFKTPIDEVTKEQRSHAKAVNFGIVYGISEFGLGEQLGISRKLAKQYIEEYLQEYSGIKDFMEEMKEKAKQTGYVETLFNRRRYIPELKSNNYMVRQFGERAAMNTPIQGTAADIMKIAMINVYKKLKEENLKSKIVLQVHDEMMLEVPLEEAKKVKQIVKTEMESAAKLNVPLVADISEADNWYDCK